MSVIVCGSCGQTEGHPPTCELGGYTTREQLAWERDAERTHDTEHVLLDERVPGCESCLLDPPSFSVRVSARGQFELAEARVRYRLRWTTLEQYDAERAEIIAAHPLDGEETNDG